MYARLSRSRGLSPWMLIVPALLLSCEESGTLATGGGPRTRPEAAVAAPPAAASEEAAVSAAAPQKWTYNPADKWDAFVVPPQAPVAPPGWNLAQMSLRGVVHGGGMEAAFLQMPDSSGKIVRINDELGQHGGRVSEIGSDYLVVEERFIDPDHPERTMVIEKKLELAKNGAGH